jgi:hypothetical protein
MTRRALIACLLAVACNHPSPACPPNQSECAGVCFNLQSSAANCGTCGNACNGNQSCVGGACVLDTCTTPDVYVSCWVGGGFAGLCSSTGQQVPTATIAAPAPDAGVVATGTVVVPELQSLVFTSPTQVWGLDVENAQIDVVSIATWPPTIVTSLAAGVAGYDPVAMIGCSGQVLLLRSEPPLLEVFNGTTGTFVNEVPIVLDGGFPYPNNLACNGTTAYVADNSDNVLFAIDLTTFAITGVLSPPASDEVAPAAADGGSFYPSLGEVAVAAPTGGAAEVFMALQNYTIFNNTLSDGGSAEVVQLQTDSTLLESGTGLGSVGAPVDLGCLDDLALTVSPDQSTVYGACGGPFHIAGMPNATSKIGVVSVSGPTAKTAITVPLSNPGSMAFLKNGLLAIGDTGQEKVAFYNPADGGVTAAMVACPPLQDGGVNPLQFISAVVPAP